MSSDESDQEYQEFMHDLGDIISNKKRPREDDDEEAPASKKKRKRVDIPTDEEEEDGELPPTKKEKKASDVTILKNEIINLYNNSVSTSNKIKRINELSMSQIEYLYSMTETGRSDGLSNKVFQKMLKSLVSSTVNRLNKESDRIAKIKLILPEINSIQQYEELQADLFIYEFCCSEKKSGIYNPNIPNFVVLPETVKNIVIDKLELKGYTKLDELKERTFIPAYFKSIETNCQQLSRAGITKVDFTVDVNSYSTSKFLRH